MRACQGQSKAPSRSAKCRLPRHMDTKLGWRQGLQLHITNAPSGSFLVFLLARLAVSAMADEARLAPVTGHRRGCSFTFSDSATSADFPGKLKLVLRSTKCGRDALDAISPSLNKVVSPGAETALRIRASFQLARWIQPAKTALHRCRSGELASRTACPVASSCTSNVRSCHRPTPQRLGHNRRLTIMRQPTATLAVQFCTLPEI